MHKIHKQITPLIESYTFSNVPPFVGIYAKNVTSGRVIGFHEDEIFGTASIIKIAIALTLFEKSKKGELDIDKPLRISNFKNAMKVGKYTNGALAFFPSTSSITLRQACFFMIHLSDNPATNLLLHFISQKEVNDYLNRHGYTKTQLTASKLDPAMLEKEKNYLGLTTAKEMTDIFAKVAQNKLVSGKNGKDLKKMLEADYPEKTYNRFLPVTWNVPDKEVKITWLLTKNGSFPKFELRTDAFSLMTDKGDIISFGIFVQNIVNKNGSAYPTNLNPDHPATLFIAAVSKILFDYLY